MNEQTVITLGQQALQAMTLIAAPLLITALLVGVVIGLFQAATQINEMTLSFVPKLLAMGLVLAISGSWMLNLLIDFTTRLFNSIPHIIG